MTRKSTSLQKTMNFNQCLLNQSKMDLIHLIKNYYLIQVHKVQIDHQKKMNNLMILEHNYYKYHKIKTIKELNNIKFHQVTNHLTLNKILLILKEDFKNSEVIEIQSFLPKKDMQVLPVHQS